MYFDFEQDIILENDKVLLRPIQSRDYAHLQDIALNEKDLVHYSPYQINTEEHFRNYIQSCLHERAHKTKYAFIIYDKVQKRYAGSSSYLNISVQDERLEIGATWIGKAFQRTGLNRNCKFLLLQYAFEKSGAMRVEFKTDERNVQSKTAIEKIGGQFEGILRSHTLMHDGFRRNTVFYSILANEWEKLKVNFL